MEGVEGGFGIGVRGWGLGTGDWELDDLVSFFFLDIGKEGVFLACWYLSFFVCFYAYFVDQGKDGEVD